jgi:peptidoglycan/xylan/chitin deacetylase (PgdA/CDA1 family)
MFAEEMFAEDAVRLGALGVKMAVASAVESANRMRTGAARLLPGAILALNCLLASAAGTFAHAAECPGNPDALGTSRVLVVDPTEHPRVGTMQYGQTLPLKDHEVVLTFDDGPLPAKSNKVLEALAAQCVKATFFTIGKMATAYPEGVRKLREAGHTIGTHSESHPLSFNRMPVEQAKQQINDGIAHTAAALGDPNAVAPFFRIPGLLRADGVEEYLASRGIMTWSADFPADDWRHITSAQVLHLALSRLEAKGKGILLLHDIQARTAAMLPTLLRELKSRGYHIVHVVPATPDLPKTATEPRDWLMHPDAAVASAWPAVPQFAYAQTAALAAPDVINATHVLAAPQLELSAIGSRGRTERIARRFAADTVPLPPEPLWPRPTVGPVSLGADGLPAPDQTIFNLQGAEPRLAASRNQHAQLDQRRDGAMAERREAMASPAAPALRRRLPGSSPMLPGGLQRGRLAPG